jgi:cellulose synthase/poly-beta-1,6-N-acetylglucosamine synthase-like glycosyltransferase
MFWCVSAFVFALLVIHPFVTYPLSLKVIARMLRRTPAPPLVELPPTAIIFCAYNEEAVIDDKLRNCLALSDADPATRTFVYTDGCSDRTVEIARSYGDSIHLVEGKTRRGKSVGMNQLVERARGWGAELLLFTDANVMVDTGAVAALRQSFADPQVGCVSGHLDYINPGESATAMVGARYWSLDEKIKQLETASGSCIGADGSIFGIRTSLFREVPENIIDDFFTSMSVLCDGWKCVFNPQLIAWERSATVSSEEYTRKIRISCRAFNCHRLLWPRVRRMSWLNIYKYVSHKLLRWFTVFWVAGFTLSAILGFISLRLNRSIMVGLPALGVLGLVAVAVLPGRPFSYFRNGFLAILATGIGVIKSLQGERFQTWSQATSTRQVGTAPTAKT